MVTGARQRRRAGGSRQMSGWAPYRPGDVVRVVHDCEDEMGDPVRHSADLRVRRVEPVHGIEPTNPFRYRVVLERCATAMGTPMSVDVTSSGVARSGTVTPLRAITPQDEEQVG